jgi:hypothetical protein
MAEADGEAAGGGGNCLPVEAMHRPRKKIGSREIE